MFQFLPRRVAQKAARPPQPALPLPPAFTSYPPRPADHPSDTKGKGKSTDGSTKDEDLVALLWLSLSDYSLWVNVDLRRAVASADEGWVPLSYVVQHSSYIPHLPVRPTETTMVKAVRAQARCPLQVRMLVSSPSKAAWYGQGTSSKEELGGYEVRRGDWSEALTRVRNWTRNEWEARSIYMESIPLSSRTVPDIFHFASSFSLRSEPTPDVQSIVLPPHHLDNPGDVPKCKGFALVTFADKETATRLVDEWPWLPRRTSAAPTAGQSSAAHEAVKYGFRVLPKARWDELKEEYLTYRQQLLDGLPQRTDGASTRDQADDVHAGPPVEQPQAEAVVALHHSAPYPPGCLVFVRNVHPETNKTTLKAFFAAHAFGGESSALDYVDYNKGMASCHLRLSTPQHAQTLVSALAACPLVQRQGLDSAGSSAASGEKAIVAEAVDGEREALYWEKVPEKVRREAVRKAVAQRGGGFDVHEEEEEDKRPRKRRRRREG